LGANARGAMRNNRIKKPDHVNAFLKHTSGELLRFCGVAVISARRMRAGLYRQATLRKTVRK
jgi:hypothetical protein